MLSLHLLELSNKLCHLLFVAWNLHKFAESTVTWFLHKYIWAQNKHYGHMALRAHFLLEIFKQVHLWMILGDTLVLTFLFWSFLSVAIGTDTPGWCVEAKAVYMSVSALLVVFLPLGLLHFLSLTLTSLGV